MLTADRLDRNRLLQLQDRKLATLGDRLRTNDYFAGRLPSGVLTRDSIRDVEPVGKDEILADQQEFPPFGRRLGVPRDHVAMVHSTGGTSGRGREIYGLSERDVEAVGVISSVAFGWAGLRTGEPAAFNVGFSNSSGGNCMLRGIQGIGATPILIGHESFAKRIELLMQFPPVGMYGTPSAINGLATTATAEGIDLRAELAALRFLLTSAEPYPLAWGAAMEDQWGAQLFEDYGLTQSASSICASTCELGAIVDGERGRMHMYEWPFYFEILDPESFMPVAPGEWGEVVVTTLDKEASPVLRFRTRDRVRFLGTDACACGRELATIEAGSITRYDDMIKIKGQNVWPAEMESTLFALPQVVEFSGVVGISDKGRDELRISVAVQEGSDVHALGTQVRSAFKTQFNFTPEVTVVALDSLASWDSPDRKARRFTDVRHDDLQTQQGGER
jgi:phenylacetate-CoA ligase